MNQVAGSGKGFGIAVCPGELRGKKNSDAQNLLLTMRHGKTCRPDGCMLSFGRFVLMDATMRLLAALTITLSFAATAVLADPGSDLKKADQALNQTFKKIQKRLGRRGRRVRGTHGCRRLSGRPDQRPHETVESIPELPGRRSRLPGSLAMTMSSKRPTFRMRYLRLALVPLAVAGCVSAEIVEVNGGLGLF